MYNFGSRKFHRTVMVFRDRARRTRVSNFPDRRTCANATERAWLLMAAELKLLWPLTFSSKREGLRSSRVVHRIAAQGGAKRVCLSRVSGECRRWWLARDQTVPAIGENDRVCKRRERMMSSRTTMALTSARRA